VTIAKFSSRAASREPLGQVIGGGVGTHGRGSGIHHLFDGEGGIAVQGTPAKPAQQHPSAACHEPEPVSRDEYPLPHLADPLLDPAGHHVVARKPTGGRGINLLAVDRQVVFKPIDLARHVVVDLGEPERFEPARGSWAHVSKRVPAVHDHRPLTV
jgi:hypothetical protein